VAACRAALYLLHTQQLNYFKQTFTKTSRRESCGHKSCELQTQTI